MMSHHGAIGSDPQAIKGQQVTRGTVRRVLGFARPYRRLLVGFLLTIFLGALLNLVPPLLFGEIIDSAIANQNRGELDLLAGLIVAAAFGQAALAFAERWFSAKIGEGLIFDLRVSLYDHV
ncbi:MAG: ABC transporter transmembrane domain-containing protein, partial [Acidimicrobiia bacterium]|nr:ABC transporter transmembrane domain-containing protein [Acidimicrobiia bacterium]